MRVLVLRSGSAWIADREKLSSLNSQGNHDAVTREIIRAGHEVLCCGRITGPLGLDCDQMGWPVQPTEENLREYVETVAAWRPEVLVNVTGGEYTCGSPDNPRGTIVQTTGIRYCWPAFKLMERLELPRIIVVTDVRCYPRDQEMTWNPWAVPRAVLSQQDVVFPRRILDREFAVHARYAGIENFRLRDVEERYTLGHLDAVVVSHSHFGESRISKNREEVWAWVLRGLEGFSYEIWGTKWGDDWENWRGETRDVQGTIQTGRCGPMIAMKGEWTSPKYREYALAGAVPLPYGRGRELYTYDPQGHACPIDHETRFSTPEELGALVRRCRDDAAWREQMIREALRRTEPDSSLLLECIEHFGSGGETDLERFGGYHEQD